MAERTNLVTSSKACPFSVGDHDVLCGRGSVCYNHMGNQQFRSLVESLQSEYARAERRLGKSLVIRKVLAGIRSNNGRFIKVDLHSGRAIEVGDVEAREKTSQAFRDALQNKYRSSNAYKHKMRKMRKRIAGTAAPSNALVSREFCVNERFGKGAPFHDGNCRGIAVASETLVAPIFFDGCEDAKIQDGNSFICKSTNIEAHTVEGSAPVISTDRSVNTACIDKLWHHSIFSPTGSHTKGPKLVDILCTFAESFDSASDPFEPLPL